MSLSPGHKRGDTFNFYLHKSITQWEPRAHAHNLKFQQTSERILEFHYVNLPIKNKP